MASDHDSLFRYTFAQPKHAASFLRTVLPTALVDAIAWASLELLTGSSVDEQLRSRHADLLFQATIGQGRVWLYLLLEHKSAPDRWTALQLMRYVGRIHDRFRDEHTEAHGLPPVVPIVVHHGARAFGGPRSVFELIDFGSMPAAAAKVLSPLQPNLHFVLDDLAAQPEHELRSRRATTLVRLTLLLLQCVRYRDKRDPVDFATRWHDLLAALWLDPAGRPAMIALFSYLASQLEAPRERIRAAAAVIHESARTMGKTIADQYREEGYEKGRVDMLTKQVRSRFGALPEAVEAHIRRADAAELDRLADRVLTAETPDDLLG